MRSPSPHSPGTLEAGDSGEKRGVRRGCSQSLPLECKESWEIGPWFHLWPHRPVAFLVNSFSEQNKDRPACAFWSLPWGIQIFRGRWEAAEKQLEPWWAGCHPARHPLFPLWSGFLLFCRQHSLQVPWNMYPLESIYNLLTSWGLILLNPRSWK